MSAAEQLMSTQHTPTPWVAAEQYQIDGLGTRGLCCIQNELRIPAGAGFNQVSRVVAELCDPTDAAHIVRCVNSHDALVEALGHLCLEAHHFADNKIGVQFLRAAIDRARTALKAATEPS